MLNHSDFLLYYNNNKEALVKFSIAIFMILTFSALYRAEALNISGVAINSGGSGVAGVMVRLGKANVSVTTGSDGSFILKANSTGINDQTLRAGLGGNCPFLLNNGRLIFPGKEQARISIMAYDCHGRLFSSFAGVSSKTNQSIEIPYSAAGIQICRISLNNKEFTFKSFHGSASYRRPVASSGKGSTPISVAKVSEQLDDALLFTKDGYQLYRIPIRNADTSGIQATMIPLTTATVKDADGNEYQTVRIGKQEWTSENLRTTKYNDGSSIPQGNYWFFKNTTDAAAKKKWGALYNFAAVKTGKLAPTGWHVPTDAEWDTLQNFLISGGYNYDGTTSDNKIAKSISAKTDWAPCKEPGAISFDIDQNNASGFSALPAGYRYYDGAFKEQDTMCYWWTSTAKDASYSWYRDLWSINFNLDRSYRVTSIGCSIRLIRDK
jgi:uncharacterized protein (TIGR02145 family)